MALPAEAGGGTPSSTGIVVMPIHTRDRRPMSHGRLQHAGFVVVQPAGSTYLESSATGAVTVLTMTTYSGPATLILADGARVAGMASLGTNHRGDLKGWSGTFRP